MNVAVAKWGNSSALRIPSNILKQLSIQIGDKLDLKIEDNRIVIEQSKPDLTALLSMVTQDNKHAEQINDQQGNELI